VSAIRSRRFSSDEWSSEERDRYLAEYARDAEAARREVDALTRRSIEAK
jgi:hypothetical protein